MRVRGNHDLISPEDSREGCRRIEHMAGLSADWVRAKGDAMGWRRRVSRGGGDRGSRRVDEPDRGGACGDCGAASAGGAMWPVGDAHGDAATPMGASRGGQMPSGHSRDQGAVRVPPPGTGRATGAHGRATRGLRGFGRAGFVVLGGLYYLYNLAWSWSPLRAASCSCVVVHRGRGGYSFEYSCT